MQWQGEDNVRVPQLSSEQKVSAFFNAFWKFLRPHTIRGTILGASTVTARALLENQHVSPQSYDKALSIDLNACATSAGGPVLANLRTCPLLLAVSSPVACKCCLHLG